MSKSNTENNFPLMNPQGGDGSKVQAVQQQVDEVIDIVSNNIEKVVTRGETLETLQNKSDDLQQNVLQFKRGSTKVRRQMWWRDLQLKLVIVGVVIIIALIIVISIVNNKSAPVPAAGTTP